MPALHDMTATVDRLAARLRRGADVRDLFRDGWDRIAGTPARREILKKRAKIFGPAALLPLGLAAWLIFRPVPQPDYRTARLDKVFNFTLLTDEFNRLPVEKRLELIRQLIDRLRGMSAGDSAMLAAFAAGIAGAARDQIEENASRLAVDLWDTYAEEYSKAPPDDRNQFLDQTFIEFTKMAETLAGEPRDISDADRLAEGRRQAERDEKNIRDGRGPSGRMLGRMYGVVRDGVGSHAAPQQRTRGQLMMRDMTRRLRGEDLNGPG